MPTVTKKRLAEILSDLKKTQEDTLRESCAVNIEVVKADFQAGVNNSTLGKTKVREICFSHIKNLFDSRWSKLRTKNGNNKNLNLTEAELVNFHAMLERRFSPESAFFRIKVRRELPKQSIIDVLEKLKKPVALGLSRCERFIFGCHDDSFLAIADNEHLIASKLGKVNPELWDFNSTDTSILEDLNNH